MRLEEVSNNETKENPAQPVNQRELKPKSKPSNKGKYNQQKTTHRHKEAWHLQMPLLKPGGVKNKLFLDKF